MDIAVALLLVVGLVALGVFIHPPYKHQAKVWPAAQQLLVCGREAPQIFIIRLLPNVDNKPLEGEVDIWRELPRVCLARLVDDRNFAIGDFGKVLVFLLGRLRNSDDMLAGAGDSPKYPAPHQLFKMKHQPIFVGIVRLKKGHIVHCCDVLTSVKDRLLRHAKMY